MSLKINNISNQTFELVQKAQLLLSQCPDLSSKHRMQLRMIVSKGTELDKASEPEQQLLAEIAKAESIKFVDRAQYLLDTRPDLSTKHQKQLRLIINWATERNDVSIPSRNLFAKIEKAVHRPLQKTKPGAVETKAFIKDYICRFLFPYVAGQKDPKAPEEKTREPLMTSLSKTLKAKGMNVLSEQEVQSYALDIYLEQSFSGLYYYYTKGGYPRDLITFTSEDIEPLLQALPEAIKKDFLGKVTSIKTPLEQAIARVNVQRSASRRADGEPTAKYRERIEEQLKKSGDTFLNLNEEDRTKLAPLMIPARMSNYIDQLAGLVKHPKLDMSTLKTDEIKKVQLNLELIFHTYHTLKKEGHSEHSPKFKELAKQLNWCKDRLDTLIQQLLPERSS